MMLLASWRALALGVALAVVSLLVAREYLRPASYRRPGLSLRDAGGPDPEPSPSTRAIGIFALALAAGGFLLALVAAVLLWRPGRVGRS